MNTYQINHRARGVPDYFGRILCEEKEEIYHMADKMTDQTREETREQTREEKTDQHKKKQAVDKTTYKLVQFDSERYLSF